MLLPLTIVLPFFSHAQDGLPELGRASDKAQEVHDRTGVTDTVLGLAMVQEEPRFPGGQEALMRYLSSNIRYPGAAMEAGVQGSVYVEFIVRRDGSVGGVKALRSPDGELTREAVRVVAAMPGWAPGKIDGRAVNVRYVLPIKFTLRDDARKGEE